MIFVPSDITVGVRAYNRPQFLLGCLNSVKKQSISGFDVLVVDDSDDVNAANENKRICADFKFRYLKPVKHLKLGGRTLNFVVKNTKTNLISFIDDDDLWHHQKLELQLAKLNTDPKIGLVTCSQKNFIQDGDEIISKNDILRNYIPEYKELLHMSGRSLGPPSAVMMKTKVIFELGRFNETTPRGPCQLLFRQVMKNNKIAACSEILLLYRVHENSITGAFGGAKDKLDVHSRLIKLQELRQDFDANKKQRFLEEKAILKLTLRGVSKDDMLALLKQYGSELKIFRPLLIRIAKVLFEIFGKKIG